MAFAQFSQILLNGLIAGSIYGLVACGFSLIYSTNKFMNFAHGSVVVASGYALYVLFALLGINFYLACLLTIAFAALFGFGINRLIYRQLQNKNASTVILLIASLTLLILFQNLLQVIFDADVKNIGFLQISKGIEIFGAIITPLQIVIILFSAMLFIALYILMTKTRLGVMMRAVSDNKELAGIVGINYRIVSDYSFLIGSALAGIAGILIGLEQNMQPTMGTGLIVRAFTGAVIGGIMSVPGAIAGSILLGIAENFGVWFLPSGYKDAVAFLLLFIFLLVRPYGIFGSPADVRK